MIKSTFKMMSLAIAGVCASMMFASCNKTPDTVAVQSVKLDETSILLYEGETQTLKATISPAEATNKSVSWTSDNTAVATVSDDGLVKAVAAGDAVITVTTADGGKTATCAVTVKASIVSVKGVTLDKSELTILIGQKETLVATVNPDNASNPAITWASSAPQFVTVSDNGEIEGVGVGSSTITVTTVDGNFTAECAVTVDASEDRLTFETNGGSSIAAQVVQKGDKAVKPADPTKAGGLDAGLYEGLVDPDKGSSTFAGWYADPDFTTAFNWDEPLKTDTTVYAKWDSSALQPIDLSAYTPTDETKIDDLLWVAFDYLSSLTLTEKTQFTYVVTEDYAYEIGGTLCCPNAEVYVVGRGEPRTISHNMSCAMFRVESGDLYLGNNLVISGNFNAFSAIILEQDPDDGIPGNVIMLDGSKICNCIAGNNSRASAVYNNNGSSKFIMKGGEICNNTLDVAFGKAYGGTLCANWGQFIIEGGKIHDNTVTTGDGTVCIGGAGSFPIQSRGNAFQKTGGEIYDNVAEFTGEGVGSAYAGQQLFIGNDARKTDQGLYKVDANLGVNDNLQMDDRTTNPLWICVWEQGK